jgi:murein DD-endopeptidase MepM/ murein hydrolase activator NlpD
MRSMSIGGVALGHLQHGSVRAKVGDTVTRGQVIGKVGSSGRPSTRTSTIN